MRTAGWAGLGGVAVLAPLVALWLLAVAFVASAQDAMVFPGAYRSDAGAATVLQVDEGRLVDLDLDGGGRTRGWLRPGRPDRAMIFFHGNGGRLTGTARITDRWHRDGFTTLAVTYPGYPGVPGTPSESALEATGRAAWALLRDRGFPADRIVLVGHSLGGGAVALTLRHVSPGAVVVQGTFTSLRRVAAERYPLLPVRPLLRHPLEAQGIWARTRSPVLVLHGAADTTVPVSHGRALARVIPDVTYVERPGAGHDPWMVEPWAWPRVRAFLARAGFAPPSGPPSPPTE
jgi:uncharacterized protein